jgi:hypothetical protein
MRKFKIGDKIVALTNLENFWHYSLPPYSIGTIKSVDREGYFVCDFTGFEFEQFFHPEQHRQHVLLEEVYNSPLFRALNEEENV